MKKVICLILVGLIMFINPTYIEEENCSYKEIKENIITTEEEEIKNTIEEEIPLFCIVRNLVDDHQEEIYYLANVMWGEAHICQTTQEKAAVAWCCLNRVDAGYGDLISVITSGQFDGYIPGLEVPYEYLDLARGVLYSYYTEQLGGSTRGRCLPKEYLFFMGDGVKNYFTIGFHDGDLQYCKNNAYTWYLPDPYII